MTALDANEHGNDYDNVNDYDSRNENVVVGVSIGDFPLSPYPLVFTYAIMITKT
ncbi:hypothetical protein GCM10009000_109860 [Halobacterium noricense]